jgi:2-methylisocitrate lyase-like PEP mutase family enzyme
VRDGGETARASLRSLLAGPGACALPGVHDGLSARLAAQAGFKAAFVSGAAVSFARLGQPDLGHLDLAILAGTVGALTMAAPDLALLVDIDTGFGNALNVKQTVRTLEAVGAAGVQIEDQTFPKRCGHLAGKSVIAVAEMAGKVAAACDARRSASMVIVARTDALGVLGLEQALDRGEAYLEAGADALFIEAPGSIDDMAAIAARFAGRVPLVHNLVEGGNSPVSDLAGLSRLGYRVGLFPLAGLHAAVPATAALLAHLHETGATADYPGPISPLGTLAELAGTSAALETGRTYDAAAMSSSA